MAVLFPGILPAQGALQLISRPLHLLEPKENNNHHENLIENKDNYSIFNIVPSSCRPLEYFLLCP